MIGNSGMFTGLAEPEAGEEIYRDNPKHHHHRFAIRPPIAPWWYPAASWYRALGFCEWCGHSDWMILSCVASSGGQRVMHNGKPVIRNLFLARGSFEVVDAWSVGGLRELEPRYCRVRTVRAEPVILILRVHEQSPPRRLDRAVRVHGVLAALPPVSPCASRAAPWTRCYRWQP